MTPEEKKAKIKYIVEQQKKRKANMTPEERAKWMEARREYLKKYKEKKNAQLAELTEEELRARQEEQKAKNRERRRRSHQRKKESLGKNYSRTQKWLAFWPWISKRLVFLALTFEKCLFFGAGSREWLV